MGLSSSGRTGTSKHFYALGAIVVKIGDSKADLIEGSHMSWLLRRGERKGDV